MEVFKFGGASVKDAQGVKNVANIIQQHQDKKLLVVVSAMGKTTNLLEKLVQAYFSNHPDDQNMYFQQLKTEHEAIARDLFPDQQADIYKMLDDLLTLLQEKLQEPSSENYDFEYDQIVSFGELLSSKIVAAFLQQTGMNALWLDARKLLRTDNTYREGTVDWETTQRKVNNKVLPYYSDNQTHIVLTQGFIGGTSEGLTTTLGREGSDFSAAVFAFTLNADKMTIWKDVDGLLNADPKLFANTIKLDNISYQEAIELAYYGASVIHPKTLKPLQNKKIPLFVRSFIHPDACGSAIGDFKTKNKIPCFICKKKQVLISIMPKDFSFIAEENLSTIFALFAYFGVKINLMQNSAISFSLCVDNKENMKHLIEELQTEFFVKYNTDVELFTIRNYDEESINSIVKGRKIILEQKNRSTVQYILKNEKDN